MDAERSNHTGVHGYAMKVGFDGEYRIGEGPWQPIVT